MSNQTHTDKIENDEMNTTNINALFKALNQCPGRLGYAKYDNLFGLGIELNGFSKSGIAILYITPTENPYGDGLRYRLTTRYDNVEYVETLDDIARVAWWWYNNYKGREPFSNPSELWAEDFVRLGYLKKVEKTVTTYEAS